MAKFQPSFETAMKVLEKLLEGKPPKTIAHELDTSLNTVYLSRERFPLFKELFKKTDND